MNDNLRDAIDEFEESPLLDAVVQELQEGSRSLLSMMTDTDLCYAYRKVERNLIIKPTTDGKRRFAAYQLQQLKIEAAKRSLDIDRVVAIDAEARSHWPFRPSWFNVADTLRDFIRKAVVDVVLTEEDEEVLDDRDYIHGIALAVNAVYDAFGSRLLGTRSPQVRVPDGELKDVDKKRPRFVNGRLKPPPSTGLRGGEAEAYVREWLSARDLNTPGSMLARREPVLLPSSTTSGYPPTPPRPVESLPRRASSEDSADAKPRKKKSRLAVLDLAPDADEKK